MGARGRGRETTTADGVPTRSDGPLPWSHAEERLESARNYWVATTRRDGRPHAAPVWGVWVDRHLYFGTARSSVKGRNLAHSRELIVHLERLRSTATRWRFTWL